MTRVSEVPKSQERFHPRVRKAISDNTRPGGKPDQNCREGCLTVEGARLEIWGEPQEMQTEPTELGNQPSLPPRVLLFCFLLPPGSCPGPSLPFLRKLCGCQWAPCRPHQPCSKSLLSFASYFPNRSSSSGHTWRFKSNQEPLCLQALHLYFPDWKRPCKRPIPKQMEEESWWAFSGPFPPPPFQFFWRSGACKV